MVSILQFSFSLSYTGPKILLYTFLSKTFSWFLFLFVSIQVSDAYVNVLSIIVCVMFVIFKFTTHSIQHLCCIHTSLSDIWTVRKNNDVLQSLMAIQWNTNRNTVCSHFKIQCFANWKFLDTKFFHVRRQILKYCQHAHKDSIKFSSIWRSYGKSWARNDIHISNNHKQQNKICKHTVCPDQSHPALLEEAKCLGWTCHGQLDKYRLQVSACPHMTDEQLYLLSLKIHKSTNFTANKIQQQFLFACCTLPFHKTTLSISNIVNKL